MRSPRRPPSSPKAYASVFLQATARNSYEVTHMKIVLRILLLITCLAAGMQSRAAFVGQMNEDIDIFLVNPANPGERPNVLIIWDTTANWGQTTAGSTAYQLEKTALSAVIKNIDPNINVGL